MSKYHDYAAAFARGYRHATLRMKYRPHIYAAGTYAREAYDRGWTAATMSAYETSIALSLKDGAP